jgi:hypothetical protein
MIEPTTGAVKAHIRDDMNGIPFAVKYFDDDKNIYLSRNLFEQTRGGNMALQYVVLAWRRNSISVNDMIDTLKTEVIEYGKETGQIT